MTNDNIIIKTEPEEIPSDIEESDVSYEDSSDATVKEESSCEENLEVNDPKLKKYSVLDILSLSKRPTTPVQQGKTTKKCNTKIKPTIDPNRKFSVSDILAFCAKYNQVESTDDEKEIHVTKIKQEYEEPVDIGNEILEEKKSDLNVKIASVKEEVVSSMSEDNSDDLCSDCSNINSRTNRSNLWFKSNTGSEYFCNQCLTCCPSMTELKIHLDSHETNHHKCPQCTLNFTCEKCLNKHIANVHESDTYSCHHCTRNYVSKKRLQSHIMVVHLGETYFCHYCMKSFPYKQSLKYHLNVHEGVKFHCAHCNKFCFNKEALKKHLEVHENRSFNCGLCSKIYMRPETFKRHMQYVHAGDQQQHKCPLCEKTFSYPGNMRTHLQAHMGHKYKCKYCPKEFSYVQNYKEHLQRHEGPEIICTYCNQKFSKNGNLVRHIKTFHVKTPFTQHTNTSLIMY